MDLSCPKSVSVVIPAYNEEDSIYEVVCNTCEQLPNYFDDYEVIVVNDGSTDQTQKILDQLVDEFEVLRTIQQSNCGFGGAMVNGIMAASKEFTAYLPADGQFLVADMRHCFELLEGSDLVLGYRGGRSDYTITRIIMSYGYLTLLTLLFGIKFMDVGWVHIWRPETIKQLNLKGSRGIFILTEIVVRFRDLGYTISEGPSYYHQRIGGVAKNASIRVTLDTLFAALKLWLKIRFDHNRARS